MRGLARSEATAKAFRAAGAESHRGDLNSLDTLRTGAIGYDRAIHLAFMHGAVKSVDQGASPHPVGRITERHRRQVHGRDDQGGQAGDRHLGRDDDPAIAVPAPASDRERRIKAAFSISPRRRK